MIPSGPAGPGRDCPLCPRLVAFREASRAAEPAWHNAPVPSFGPLDARLLVVGMAPGLRGANRTGRPFTGDFAGLLLYRTLIAHGFARGDYRADPSDGVELDNCRIANAVRCVPPANLPTPLEARTCNAFLIGEMAAMPRLRIVLALGTLAHAAVLRARGVRLAAFPFRHGAVHDLPDGGPLLAESYHVSRYNTSTRLLTEAMFSDVVADLRNRLATVV